MFVVLEGGEGSGKSTQCARLAARVAAAGWSVVKTAEPGGTALGAGIRRLLLHDDAPLDPAAEVLLLLADRAQHLAEVVRPALADGAVVVCDRFVPSTLAYQGVGRGLGLERMERQCAEVVAGTEPDLVVVLDVSEDEAKRRRPVSRDRLEAEGETFHRAVRAAYRDLAPDRGWVVVDGEGPADEVEARVWAVVAARLGGTAH